jgi:uncharacterized protein (DUF58 family)
MSGGLSDDRTGLDDSRNYLTEALGALVPRWLARRALSVTVETDRERYAVGDPVELTVTIRNRFPVPVVVRTPRRRLWGWSVDGEVDASDERLFRSDAGGELVFRGGERKVMTRRWNGRFKRTGDRTRWVEPTPGVHEVTAFVALGRRRPESSVEIRFE